jgi:Tfp pilus assembly protein PilP
MKLKTGFLLLGVITASAWAQNPDIIQNTRDTMHAVQQKKAMDSNAALAASQGNAGNPGHPSAPPVAHNSTATASQPASVEKSIHPAKAVAKQATKSAKPAAQNRVEKKVAQKVVAKKTSAEKIEVEAKNKPSDGKKAAPKTISMAGRRDPFVSPVVNRGFADSGCSTGKKCLTIEQIDLKGVVKSDSGFIAVVVNAVNKAYFLRQNDPVFNGYVVKITGDSIVFKQNMQDKLGKSFQREVTKRITTPAV